MPGLAAAFAALPNNDRRTAGTHPPLVIGSTAEALNQRGDAGWRFAPLAGAEWGTATPRALRSGVDQSHSVVQSAEHETHD